jgi:hypothetical protein
MPFAATLMSRLQHAAANNQKYLKQKQQPAWTAVFAVSSALLLQHMVGDNPSSNAGSYRMALGQIGAFTVSSTGGRAFFGEMMHRQSSGSTGCGRVLVQNPSLCWQRA